MDIRAKLKSIQDNYVKQQKRWGNTEIKTHDMVLAWQPRKQRFKACNGKCTLNVPSLDGWSYEWWQVTRVVNGKLVFNNYHYSNTTTGHQHTIRNWIEELGYTIDLVVECPNGLQHEDWFYSAISHYCYNIGKLKALNQFGTKRKNAERNETIKELNKDISRVAKFGKLSHNEINKLRLLGEKKGLKSVEIEREYRKNRKVQKVIARLTA